MRGMKHTTLAIIQGQGGVHRVLAELIDRGHTPYLPVIDHGVDILLESGVRLQVKTTQRPTQHWRYAGSWSFTLTRAQRIVKRKYVACVPRMFSESVDFIILVAAEARRFWIVPAPVLDGRNTVCFKDGRKQWKDCDIVEAKRLREEGWSYQAIADQLGLDQPTIRRRLSGKFAVPKRHYADIAQYENRWDLITGALATLTEATHIVDSAASAPVGGREHVLTP